MSKDNKNYEIEVNVYNMEFWKNGFTHDNIEFIPYEDYKERYEKIKNEKIHYPTGKAKISLSADTCNEAIKNADIILSDYGRLLTFAQDRDVFFHYYTCYKVEKGDRHKKAGLRSVVVGVDNPYGMSIIHPAGIEEFIKIAIPLVRDEAYVERTGIVRAINWFIVANQRHIKIVPTVYPIFWIALEMLANVHAKANGKEFIIFEESEFKIVENKFEALIENDLVLFSIDGELEEGLNKGIVPEGLKKKMVETEGISFSKNITITKEKEGKWVIIDEEKKNTYIVRKENGKLNIYLKLNSKERKTLKRNVRGINRRPIEHKVGSLLKEYGLEQYNPEIKKLKDFRDDVIHGNPLSYDFNEKIDNERKLKRILEKLMLSMLHFYDNDNMFVRSAIRQNRLLAVQ